jgi:hypothetical protein
VETKVTDMLNIVPHIAERRGEARGKCIVHEKSHAVGTSGNSRSRTASAA